MADGRKLDSDFRADDSTRVLLPIHQLYMRAQAATWVLLRFTLPLLTYCTSSSSATSWNRCRPVD
jgi:hypothetical protein